MKRFMQVFNQNSWLDTSWQNTIILEWAMVFTVTTDSDETTHINISIMGGIELETAWGIISDTGALQIAQP